MSWGTPRQGGLNPLTAVSPAANRAQYWTVVTTLRYVEPEVSAAARTDWATSAPGPASVAASA